MAILMKNIFSNMTRYLLCTLYTIFCMFPFISWIVAYRGYTEHYTHNPSDIDEWSYAIVLFASIVFTVCLIAAGTSAIFLGVYSTESWFYDNSIPIGIGMFCTYFIFSLAEDAIVYRKQEKDAEATRYQQIKERALADKKKSK